MIDVLALEGNRCVTDGPTENEGSEIVGAENAGPENGRTSVRKLAGNYELVMFCGHSAVVMRVTVNFVYIYDINFEKCNRFCF